MLREIAEFFKDSKDILSDHTRSILVKRFCQLVANHLKTTNEKAYTTWIQRDRSKFSRDCEIVDRKPIVKFDKDELERWADKWLQVNEFRLVGSETWRPITPEQNALRVTMINDLRDTLNGHASSESDKSDSEKSN